MRFRLVVYLNGFVIITLRFINLVLDFILVLMKLLVLLKTHLFPYTRVCGLNRGGYSDLLVFCLGRVVV